MRHVLGIPEAVKTDFVRGQGCTLYDSLGRRYTDFESGIWCTALGHNHPRINRAIHDQVEQVMHLGSRNPSFLAEGTAMEVLSIANLPEGKCTFLSSGSEAVEYGVQAIRRITGQPLLLTFANSYLAAYGSAGSKSPAEWVCFDWSECATCSNRDDCDPRCSRLRGIPFERTGGMVLEPGNSGGTVRLPPAGLVRTLADAIRKGGGLLMANEITTGMGRTGKWFGFQHYNVQPDLIAIGKGLGNGYPVSCVAMAFGVAERLETSGLRYAQSHQNDPLGCAVAKEVIAVLREERLVERSERVGHLFLHSLQELATRRPVVKEARGRGLMLVLDLAGDDDRRSAASLCRLLLEAGFLAGYNPTANLLRFYPALVIEEDDVIKLLDQLDRMLAPL